MVGEASILCRDELTPPSGYRPLPNVGEGLNKRIAYACRRLLDACPEIDRGRHCPDFGHDLALIMLTGR